MKRIVIGNDFRVNWTLTQLGEAFSLEGKIYEIEVSSPYGVILVNDVVAEDNILSFSIPASQQVYLGNYDITLKITNEDGQTWRLKQCDAFALVPCDCGEIVEVVQFASGIVYPANGLDAYQLAVSSGEYTGDYEGYQRWLARYAENTANEAVNIANEAKENSSTALSTARQASKVANEAKTVVATKQDALTLTVKDNGNIVIGNLQGQAKEFMPATPSGDPMHMAYVAAGAVWNDTTKTWSANGRSGLSNSDVRSLYNKADMDELLFRRLWNSCNAITYENNKVKYDENTGFYRANGVWHIEYEEALEIFAKNPYITIGDLIMSSGINYTPITTIAMIGYHNFPFYGYTAFWNRRLIDLRRNAYSTSDNGFPNNVMLTGKNHDSVIFGYCYNLRIVRDIISWETTSTYNFRIEDRCNCLTHLLICNRVNNVGRVFNFSKAPRLSYLSVYYFLNNSIYGCTLQLHPDVYSYITGTANPEEMGMSPVMPEYSTYYYIPYQQNLKILPDNAFWREELDVKGINGEYIYPSFAEYLANNPQNLATAEEWQALATLAEEKGITITTQ